ncbi:MULTISPECIES: hypothetical protein [unclassified Sphingobacterium]|uniref:hypothetical protein n=1 Tax=unclassified Sphingobacterium TaxID=2609468 RepID=UPI0025D20891|nr:MULTISPECIES: hypothetical protein [unclassified Sphingobacterium]
MKNLNYFIVIIVVGCLTSCRKEAPLKVQEDPRSAYFLPNESATDEESIMRRSFFTEEKSYLLFNDTLRNEFLGVDYNGDKQYRTERLNMGYILAGTVDGLQSFTHLLLPSIEEKRASVAFMKNYVLPDLPYVLRPYSWFLTSSTEIIDVLGMPSYPVAIAGERSVAVSLGGIATLSDNQKSVLASQIIATTVAYKVAKLDDVAQRFYAVSQTLYGTQFPVVSYTEEENKRELLQRGFIVQNWFIEGLFLLYGSIPSREKDLESYVKLVFTSTDEEVNAQYAQYPVVMQKYRLLKTIFTEEGYLNR